MDTTSTAWGKFAQTVQALLDSLITHAPSLLLAILVLVAGWLIARLMRHAARHASDGANRLLDRVFRRGLMSGARLSPAMIAVVGEVAFWIVMFFTVVVAANVAGLTTVTAWLGRVLAHLPNLFAGVAIIVVGYFLGLFVREKASLAAQRAASPQGPLLGRLAQGAVVAVALIVGLDQIGVDVTIVVALVAVSVGGVVLGLSAAYALGARQFVSNLIGARNARHVLGPGLRVRIGDVEGDVLEITATHIALDTAAGKLLIPARVADAERILIITAGEERDDSES